MSLRMVRALRAGFGGWFFSWYEWEETSLGSGHADGMFFSDGMAREVC